MKTLMFVPNYLSLFILLFSACSSRTESGYQLPLGFKHSVLNKEESGGKTELMIEINMKCSKMDLNYLAQQFRREYKFADRLFVFYYLPGMETGKGAWATSHFNEKLEINFIGSTKDQDSANLDVLKQLDMPLEGLWRSEQTLLGASLALLAVKPDSLIMKTLFKDGSAVNEVIVLSSSPDGNRLDYDNSNGEYYILEKNGNLGFYNNEGKFGEAVQLNRQ